MPRFEGASGQVYYRHWAPLKPTAQIVFLHGYGEHSGLYHRFANSLNAQGIGVWALDAIGHGLSDGERGNPGSMAYLRTNAERLTGIAQREDPGLPMALVGHSMGAMTAAAVVIAGAGPFRGVVLGGMPVEGISQEQERQAEQGVMSLDPFYLDELEFDPLKFDASMAFVHLRSVLSAPVCEQIQAGLLELSLPALMISGDKDMFCPPDLARRWASRIPGAKHHLFANTHHDLINDASHADVADVIAQAVIGWTVGTRAR
ncbi:MULTISPECIES: alpha/beta fold hydrolase [unclassified Mesorhizobium]|uniref:alpha/beta hydrolase n=1 Tax=unclassified Mesorhizobium TaxID=325217 RepID=UPI000FCBFB70|nr:MULTISPECIES: alpha/beta fold hydrolase [unclassified Mesorhizobium]TGT53441.1 alpha/beta fold hydrolase [Mesorhizobium sp. M00.F.Ca.ET.170.01.1.1]RUX52555.1 alpha/beta fold hydrolase [Mesorhizobium sp. M4A.F.Ca.ET.050.02.1.1]RWB73253.1 MAG: alpha/beta fold hydrolase [Mesorhizobium sp.]RWB90827.1 MAG: alpha/beta fold hydrolase [Mesorhizobium sp.]RWC17104.1 MAG: alpha/beta fold hydrolase [Mesorhizobium sp.]